MDSSTLLSLAQNAVDIGNIKAACEFYEVALLNFPNNEDVLEAYAEIMIHHAQDIPRAKQMLSHAIEVNPNRGYVKYLNLAQLSDAEEGLKLYQKAHDIARLELSSSRKKKSKQALRETLATICCAITELYLTDLCFAPNAEKACEEWIRKALEYNPNAVEAHQLHASVLISQNNLSTALDSLRKAVDLTHRLNEEHQPTYESKVELARLLLQVSADEAFSFLLELLQLGDNNPYVWFLLGECARLRKQYADAARLLRRARIMLVVSDGDTDAIQQVDTAIQVLVEEMGGPEEAAKVPELDHPDPISVLQSVAELGTLASDEDVELDEPTWELSQGEDAIEEN